LCSLDPTEHPAPLRRGELSATVSVVVPAHNEEALLSRCLQALLAQDYPHAIEIIVVDNASTDRTAEIARRPGVTVIHEPQRDYCKALIRGFETARGEIVALTDADSVVPCDWISRLVGEYRDGVVAVGGNVVFERPNWKGWLIAKIFVPAFNWLDRHDPRGPHLWGSNLSVRREAFERIGGWNSAFSLEVDSEISERLRKIGRVRVLGSIKVQTSSRRWNRALLHNLFIYVTNYVWMKLLARPLWRDFPVIREEMGPPRHRLRVALAVAAALLLLVALGFAAFGPRSSMFGKTYWRGDASERIVALSFDDGPNEPYTSRVLDILKREHVRATFFLVGDNVRLYPTTAARIVQDGHAIGNHSDHHNIPFALEPASELATDVGAAEESIRSATGQLPRLFRPPQGLRSPWLMRVLARDSLITVTWDDAPGDWDPLPVQTIVNRTVRNAKPGSIILLHDGMNAQHGADQSETVNALPGIIDGLRARGYQFVTLPELLHCPATLSSWPPQGRQS
jgi:peptidoglycan/xylan/chitin deacetylase (PgdA/CDA1 family)